MIVSPVEINTDGGEMLRGVLLEGGELAKVIEIIDGKNENGLPMDEAALLMKLKEAYRDLYGSESSSEG